LVNLGRAKGEVKKLAISNRRVDRDLHLALGEQKSTVRTCLGNQPNLAKGAALGDEYIAWISQISPVSIGLLLRDEDETVK
jgi:hypothetical protein